MTVTVTTQQAIPTKLTDQETYYWMDDHIEVGSAFLDLKAATPYLNKHSFCPAELLDPTEETPFGFYEIKVSEKTGQPMLHFHRLEIEMINSEFKTTLLLLGVDLYE